MGPSTTICVQRSPFDVLAEIKRIRQGNDAIGAIVNFTGVCRDDYGTLEALELEHYPQMADKQLLKIATSATKRWQLEAVTIIHRFGRIAVGDDIVLVIVAAVHRKPAFDAASFIMDFLKTDAPFWKKEHRRDGTNQSWVQSSNADISQRRKWQE